MPLTFKLSFEQFDFNDEEIQKISLSDSNNEIFIYIKITKNFLICIIILKLF